ncbi:hypothetical protein BC939DRAFT_483959 [Gamsiella multidivaricata]|uniref:uncharacterized protein n=1 Tax=Gamsiella multidivaricata TaxID=101098 RepID=UPI0022201EE7|nr:uncharacterized protein BC939DRAFT_483959 [Gamsiella multidivaricata]KAI7824727.1 hypothetical protein BC939DRAFT_483959 [Gamsiella multidivaricata]
MSGNVYTAVYSGVHVYEFMCRGIAVMRRKQDSYLNATQILKVAGMEKGKRTKILERDVLTGEHEKVQGGYGKYQGTWIPFQRGKDLAIEYKVEPLLRPLFDHNVLPGEIDNVTPTKEMVMGQKTAHSVKKQLKGSASPRTSSTKRARSSSAKPAAGLQTFNAASMTPSPLQPSFNAPSPSIPPSPRWSSELPPRKRIKANQSPSPYDRDYSVERDMIMDYERDETELLPSSKPAIDNQSIDELLEGVEKYRSILMAIFLNDETEEIPSLLTDPTEPEDLDIDLGHTALHWAAALARIPVLELLVQKHAGVRRVNLNGESALVRAVLVTNNFDRQSFPHLLDILHHAIPLVDRKNRTLLHHIAVTAGMRGRAASAHYYMECLLEWIARHGGDFSSLVDVQDKNGDTALTIAARVGDRYLAKFLIDVGANRELENKVGLKAGDFGIDDIPSGPTEQPFMPRNYVQPPSTELPISEQNAKRGREVVSVVQKMVEGLDLEFSQEILAKNSQLKDTQVLLRQATRELTETRKTISQCRSQVRQLEEAHQKIKNLEASLDEESQKTRRLKGYTGKTTRANEDIDSSFNVRKPVLHSTTGFGNNDGGTMSEQPTTDLTRERIAERDVIQLRSRVYAYQKNDEELSRELAETRSKTSANELLCKKVIAICCNIPLERVDDMLVPLTLAVESDGASLDLSRVAGFMSRVKQQEALAASASNSA